MSNWQRQRYFVRSNNKRPIIGALLSLKSFDFTDSPQKFVFNFRNCSEDGVFRKAISEQSVEMVNGNTLRSKRIGIGREREGRRKGEDIQVANRWTRSLQPSWRGRYTLCRYFENSNFDTENRTWIVHALIERMPLRQPRRWQTCSTELDSPSTFTSLSLSLSCISTESVSLQ